MFTSSHCDSHCFFLYFFRGEILAGVGHWQARPPSEEQCKGTSGGVVPDTESILKGEVLRLSHVVEKKDAEVTRLRASLLAERGNRERDMSETTRIQFESDLLTLRAEVDRLQAELHSERDRAFVERVASAAQVDELRTKLKSFEASMQSGAIVASVPPPLSLSEERALIHDQYAERIDRMQRGHDEVVADLPRSLDRYR